VEVLKRKHRFPVGIFLCAFPDLLGELDFTLLFLDYLPFLSRHWVTIHQHHLRLPTKLNKKPQSSKSDTHNQKSEEPLNFLFISLE
jgi:hypothetical protein